MRLVSVIIPIYNCENNLDRCINSVLNQTYKNIELILVNDGSIDSSGDICDFYSKKINVSKLYIKKTRVFLLQGIMELILRRGITFNL